MKLVLIILLNVSSWAFAASKDYSKTWIGIFTKKNFDPSYSFWQEAQLRYQFNEGSMQQTLIRFGLLKRMNEHHETGLLMAYVQTGLSQEYRPTLHHLYTNQFSSKLSYAMRSRLEFRQIADEDAESIRYRLMLSARYQLTSTLSSVIFNEPLINLTSESWTGDQILERNRFFIGVRIESPTHRWEVGYLNQYIPRRDFDISEHILQIYLFL